MKPAAFAYHAPMALDEALDLLARYGDDCKVLAGGQSLVPTMNFRLAKPGILIDINGLPDLAGVTVDESGLRIGALTRHAAFHRPALPGPLGTLLPAIVRHIAHEPIRQRGTFGGSLAHADPASEWCLVTVALGGEIEATSTRGRRRLAALDFFRGALTTDLADDELLSAIHLPAFDAGWTFGFHEVSRRAGDFALAAALVGVRIEADRIVDARVGIGGVADRALRLGAIEAELIGARPDAAIFAGLAAQAPDDIALSDQPCATSPYRRDLLAAVLERALRQAVATSSGLQGKATLAHV